MSVCGTVTDPSLLEAFLGSIGSAQKPYSIRVPPGLSDSDSTDFPVKSTFALPRSITKPRWLTFLRHPIDNMIDPWYGLLTCFPSSTPLGLDLGPTHPGRINLAQETLGLRRTGFSPVLSLLVPTFSFPLRPALLTVCLHSTVERSPTTWL